MKAFLMFRGRDFDLGQPLPPNEKQLVHDLDLETLFNTMAGKDEFLLKVCRAALLSGLNDPEEISYRQDVLSDCLANAQVVRDIYELTVNALQDERKLFWFVTRNSSAGMILQSPQVIAMYMEYLKKLRNIVDQHSSSFQSEGWTTMFHVLTTELTPQYFDVVDEHARKLKFKNGTLLSARLGYANSGIDYVLRDPSDTRQTWQERLNLGGRRSYSFEIAPRDEAGSAALANLLNRGVNLAANALTQAADHVSNFFKMLRTELAFYVASLNLYDALSRKDEPICRPEALPWSPARLEFVGLYDTALSLRNEHRVVGNDVNADGKTLLVVTGANSGGKSTFLRSLAEAHLMMRAGMFVAATSFKSSVASGVFTHFVREEDPSMTSGKLDEELARMSEIASQVTPGCVVLFNESFSATNEREGSEIARQVLTALVDCDVRAVVVTHLYDLAESVYRTAADSTLFLKAPRESDAGQRYKLRPGEPLSTSFAEDVYERIGGW